MKSLWSSFSFLAVVHLLALLMFVGWLAQSGRLSMERLEAVRDLFQSTIADDAAAAEAAAADAEFEATAAFEDAKLDVPPRTADQQVRLANRIREQERRAADRLAEQREQLQRQLDQDRLAFDAERVAFEAERAAWEQMVEEIKARQADEQFIKAVKLLENTPAKLVKARFLELVDNGELDQAVAYFDAMNARAQAKVFKEFKTDAENELATVLLEELRTLGQTADLAQEPSDAAQPPSADNPPAG